MFSRIMASSGHSFSPNPKRTVVVSNFPADVGEDELTIHFQNKKSGGGDVDEVVIDGNIAFVIFNSPEGLDCFIIEYLNCLYCKAAS